MDPSRDPGTPVEVLVFIHGVTSLGGAGTHLPLYRALDRGVAERLPPTSPWHAAVRCGVEWGWDYPPADAGAPPAGAQRLLADAQRHLVPRVLDTVDRARDLSIFPARWILDGLRPLMAAGFADMFYYVSAEGKAAIRLAVARQILRSLRPVLDRPDPPPVSLTLIGHSAGSVIAFDLAFYLFYRRPGGGTHAYLREEAGAPPGPGEVLRTRRELARLHEMARAGRLRVRRLLTFGSPLAMLAYRSDEVVRLLARGEGIDPAWHGLVQNPPAFPEPLARPRWLNFWDRDDPIAWPVEPMMDPRPGAVADVYLDVEDRIARAHGRYWTDGRVQRAIAEGW